MPDVKVLDRTSDAEHNRSVITFAGSPEKIGAAAFLAIEKAVELIDMRVQHGKHPRIGATDVMPFVPIKNTVMQGKTEAEQNACVYSYELMKHLPSSSELSCIYDRLSVDADSGLSKYGHILFDGGKNLPEIPEQFHDNVPATTLIADMAGYEKNFTGDYIRYITRKTG